MTPAEPAAAGAVIPFGTAAARCCAPPALPAGPPTGPPAAPATVVPVSPPAMPLDPTLPPDPVATLVAYSGDTLGTRMTTKSKTSRPTNNGEYRRATFAM
ncbi:MAG: hypothetical protein JO176_13240 [Acidimicrobiia bacterium]|nr:hypothetical protein [Acidimicrobiia bacterium]